jgi:hypothetical protein
VFCSNQLGTGHQMNLSGLGIDIKLKEKKRKEKKKRPRICHQLVFWSGKLNVFYGMFCCFLFLVFFNNSFFKGML